jgi:hypothetical protein
MFCCFRKLAGMQPKIASEYLPPLPKGGRGGFNDRPKETPNISPFRKGQNISIFCKGQNISPFRKGGRGNFHSREVMVETEAVMEKIYRVIEIPPDPPFSKGGNVLPFFKGGGMFCCFRKLAGMQPKIASEYLPPLPKGGRGGI